MRLLVEGRDDCLLFRHLLDTLSSTPPADSSADLFRTIDIDSAELLRGEAPGQSNREKVEALCSTLPEGEEYSRRIVGFVDREYRLFDLASGEDTQPSHRLNGRLVWSRGHSIENYCFSPAVLERPLSDLCPSVHTREAMVLFRDRFPSALRLACGLALAATRLDVLGVVRSRVHWKLIQCRGQDVAIDWISLKACLIAECGFDSTKAEAFEKCVAEIAPRIGSLTHEVAQWMTHGHMGIAIVWALFAFCLAEVAASHGIEPSREVSRFFSAPEEVRKSSLFANWSRAAVAGQEVWPKDVFRLFGAIA